jgi:hypothetical protein
MCLSKLRKAKVHSKTKISGILLILQSRTNAPRYAPTGEIKERV